MSRAALREELERRIQALGSRIAEDEAKLLKGDRPDKVEAAGEIAALRSRQAELKERLAELRSRREEESGWESFATAIQRDLLDLDTAVQRWARKYY